MALPNVGTTLIYDREPMATASYPIANGVTVDVDDVLIGMSTGGVAGPLTNALGTYLNFLGVLQPNGRYPLPATGDASLLTEVVVSDERITLRDVDVTGVTGVTDHEQPVYASDAVTLTLTSTNNTLVGFIQRFRSTGKADVRLFTHDELLAPRS